MKFIRMLALASVFMSIAFLYPAFAKDSLNKQRFAEGMEILDQQPEATLEIMHALAAVGYPRAMERLGYFYLKGIGVEADLSTSVFFYQQAVDAGQTRTLISLGRVQILQGNFESALQALKRAVELDVPQAATYLAWAHATERFGKLSDTSSGIADLLLLSRNGDLRADIFLLEAQVLHAKQLFIDDEVLNRLNREAEAGNPKVAEALLRYYRRSSSGGENTRVRAVLLKTPGIREKLALEEKIYLASELESKRFWLVSEELVRSASKEAFPRALSVTAKLNKNAYVRILQMELNDLGYDTGHASAYLTQKKIEAINQFCRDHAIVANCVVGPLKSQAVKALAAQLAEVRCKTVVSRRSGLATNSSSCPQHGSS